MFYFLLSFLWSQIFLQNQIFAWPQNSSISLMPFRHLRDQFSDDFSVADLLSAPAWCWCHCSANWAMTVIKTSVFSPEHSRLLCGWQQGRESLQEWFFWGTYCCQKDSASGPYWQKKKLNTINWRMNCIFTSCSLLVTANFTLKFCCYQIIELNSSFLQKVFFQLQIFFPLQQ